MKALTYFFRHPHAIYFSMEKLFHAIAGEVARQPQTDLFVKEAGLPFTSSLKSLRKNISFVHRNQSAINHITGDVHYTILGCDKKNINILTIHDCVLLYRFSKANPKYWIVKWLWYDLPVKRADMITVISENTKKDLTRFTRCAPAKIRVIPNFLDPLFIARPRNSISKKAKLLFIGTAPNKNLERTIEAIGGLDVELIIVGYPDESQIEQLKRKSVPYRVLNQLSDTAMRDIYADADIMIFPSVHEGFGLPIIEAQATGRAVLTSEIEPMASVAGGGACLVNPHETGSIRAGIIKLMENEDYRNNLIEKGFSNIKRFQLGAVTKQYTDLYSELIKKKAG